MLCSCLLEFLSRKQPEGQGEEPELGFGGFYSLHPKQEQDCSLFSVKCQAQGKGTLRGWSLPTIWEDLSLIQSTREEALSTTPGSNIYNGVKLWY